MTKVLKKLVTCANCEAKSEQLMVYSVNFALGKKENNEKLINHQQVCPNCDYTAPLIYLKPKPETESENN